MNTSEFIKYFEQLVEKEKKILLGKGIEYSGEVDRFANFKRLGEDLGMKPEEALWVYLKKHLDSILTYIKEGKERSEEGIESRIHDARNYLALLGGLIEEKKKFKKSLKKLKTKRTRKPVNKKQKTEEKTEEKTDKTPELNNVETGDQTTGKRDGELPLM